MVHQNNLSKKKQFKPATAGDKSFCVPSFKTAAEVVSSRFYRSGISLRIDCELIEETDISGLQLLNVWCECAGLRGIQPKLINVTNGMRRAINELGFSRCFSQRSLYNHYADKPMDRGNPAGHTARR